jgi:hypothetical protein
LDNQIVLEALVQDYIPDAMTDQYEEGPPASFDATVIKVLSPGSLRDRSISIYHDRPEPPESLWRQQGEKVQLRIELDMLEEGIQVFSGAVSDLRLVK